MRKRALAGALLGAALLFGAASGAHAQSTTTGKIIVDKVTVPAGATTTFSFDARGTGYTDFTLTDGSARNEQVLATGTYRIVESPTRGWKLSSSTCSTNGATSTPYVSGSALTLGANETITCTFTNTQATSSVKGDGKHNGWFGFPWGIFKKIWSDDFPGFDQKFFKNFFDRHDNDDEDRDNDERKANVGAKIKVKTERGEGRSERKSRDGN